MAGVTWLHLSDWHHGRHDADRRDVARALVRDVERRREIHPDLETIDFIVFSGDIAYSGNEDQYGDALELLIDPLLKATGLGDERFVVVPGNHDFDRARDEAMAAFRTRKQNVRSFDDLREMAADKDRDSALLPMQGYREFARRFVPEERGSPDFGCAWRFPIAGDRRGLLVLGLNSAWMCSQREVGGHVDDYGYLLVGDPQFGLASSLREEDDLVVTVLHHPLEWLRGAYPNERYFIRRRLYRDSHFILHGHEHLVGLVQLQAGSGECVVISAGASYNRPDADHEQPYRKSYNYVHLDLERNDGTIYFRTFTSIPERPEWVRDNALTGDLTPGFITFRLPAKSLPPRRRDGPPPTNFAAEPGLVGREAELHRMAATLRARQTRLMTLTGPGGVGKTRLARQLASDLLESYPDGAFFVNLSQERDPALVPVAIARGLNLPDEVAQAGLPGLQGALRDKRMLLVLDNLEQVSAFGESIPALLNACPGLTVVVTSRSRLNVTDEDPVAIAPLRLPNLAALPAAEELSLNEAVRLFLRHAAVARPDFALTEENRAAVAEICVRLDGLPLAIELVAPRLATFVTAEELLAEMDRRGLLPLLAGGRRDLDARQQTMAATIKWSCELLDAEAEQPLFRRLSVFAAGCTRDDAERVCTAAGPLKGDLRDALAGLIDKNLVRAIKHGARARYGMLETVRQSGLVILEQSGDATATRDAFVDWIVDLAESGTAGPPWTPRGEPEQTAWLDRLDVELGNIRAALRWCTDQGDAERLLRLTAALPFYWVVRGGATEGLATLEAAIATGTSAQDEARAKALLGAGWLALQVGLPERAQAAAKIEEAQALYERLGNAQGVCWSLQQRGTAAIAEGRFAAANALLEEARQRYEQFADAQGVAWSLHELGKAARLDALARHDRDGDAAEVAALLERAADLQRQAGDRFGTNQWGYAWSLHELGNVRRAQQRPAEEVEAQRQALDLLTGDRRGRGWALRGLATAERELARQALAEPEPDDGPSERARMQLQAAADHLGEAFGLFAQQGDRRGVALTLGRLATVEHLRHNEARAVWLLGAGFAVKDVIGPPPSAAASTRVVELDELNILQSARDRLGWERFGTAWAEGQRAGRSPRLDRLSIDAEREAPPAADAAH